MQATRRKLLTTAAFSLLVPLLPKTGQAASLLAVRMWPSADYTRVTLELDRDVTSEQFILQNPLRLVVDIKGITMSPTLQDLVSKVKADDPYVSGIRIAQNRPDVVRMVFDLKQPVRPQIFTLKPVAQYKHRLVLDMYPLVEVDPLLALLKKDPQPQEQAPATKNTPPEPKAAPIEQSKPNPPQKQNVKRLVTIALDPGHGGEDPGAVGPNGTREKDVVLKIARLLKQKIDAQPNMRAMLTRDGDYFVPLGTRVRKARDVEADLFISIHADAWTQPTANGSSVFALSERGASSTAASWLAKNQNDADLIGGVSLTSKNTQVAKVLLDLSTTAQITDSLKLGKAVLTKMGGINRLHKNSVEQANFAVLKAPDIPSILIETAFISNPQEESKLKSSAFQGQMADAIMTGIKEYFSKNPPLAKGSVA